MGRWRHARLNYVHHSRGCDIWIIGNETNHENERPDNVVIEPEDYAACFALCRTAIKKVNPTHCVVPAPCAPYHANPTNWIDYWQRMLRAIQGNGGCDGIAIHAYTRSSNPDDITSSAMMGPPLETTYSGFYTYRDALTALPQSMHQLPVYLTEFNEILPDGWDNRNSGVVQAAYAEIDNWNTMAVPKIHCLICFRWPHHDQWYIEGKQGVVDDFNQAVTEKYYSPLPIPPIPPLQPQPAPTTKLVHPLQGSRHQPALGAERRRLQALRPVGPQRHGSGETGPAHTDQEHGRRHHRLFRLRQRLRTLCARGRQAARLLYHVLPPG